MRHEDVVGGRAVAEFGGEVVEGLGGGEIEDGVGFAAVTIASGDEGDEAFLGEAGDLEVLLKRAEAIEFEGMDLMTVLIEKAGEHVEVEGSAEAGFVPKRVIENDEGVGVSLELVEHLIDGVEAGLGGDLSHGSVEHAGASRLHVVDTKVEEALA